MKPTFRAPKRTHSEAFTPPNTPPANNGQTFSVANPPPKPALCTLTLPEKPLNEREIRQSNHDGARKAADAFIEKTFRTYCPLDEAFCKEFRTAAKDLVSKEPDVSSALIPAERLKTLVEASNLLCKEAYLKSNCEDIRRYLTRAPAVDAIGDLDSMFRIEYEDYTLSHFIKTAELMDSAATKLSREAIKDERLHSAFKQSVWIQASRASSGPFYLRLRLAAVTALGRFSIKIDAEKLALLCNRLPKELLVQILDFMVYRDARGRAVKAPVYRIDI